MQQRLVCLEQGALVLGATGVLAAGRGLLLASMLLVMLQHVCDPPPENLAIPWAYLGELAGGVLVATTVAVATTAASLKRLLLGRLLREQ